ncbi:DUF4397 domain-containing protein [Actinocorallia longicatena]|uniref:DUF4397 domain-containing protein n=1 Tax=Actinocorallia longicatena TaxID=111803 RepID=A0ABP6Q8Y0_9ACTN
MTPRIRIAAVAVVAAASIAPTAAAHAAPEDGYVRLAHLSPDTPAVDVYLYDAGKKKPRLVLKHVGYGALSPYQKLGTGSYTVAMRPADAAASSDPVLSTSVKVEAGGAYTVAGMGPYKGIKLQVLDDAADLGSGRAGVRVLAASLKNPTLDVKAPGLRLKGLTFAGITDYQQAKAGKSVLKVTGAHGSASKELPLSAGSLYTVVVLDRPSGLDLLPILDTTGGKVVPNGAIDTGMGGLAERPSRTPSPLWLLLPAAALAAFVVRGRRTTG